MSPVPPRVRLDRQKVVECAAEMADATGGEVSLAALASKLGVRTPSLYNHISGQAELRREMALLGLRELRDRMMRAAVGKSGDDALCATARAYLEFGRERPGLYATTLQAADPADAGFEEPSEEIVSILVAVMSSYGLEGKRAIHAIRGLRSMLHGFVSLEAAGGFGMPIQLDESFQYALTIFISGLRSYCAADSEGSTGPSRPGSM